MVRATPEEENTLSARPILSRRLLLTTTLIAATGFANASSVQAQADAAAGYPKQPIKFVIGFAPGGGNDLMGRVIGQKLSEKLGQPVVIENKPGAASIIAAEQVARAAPDGYTLLVAPIGALVGNPAVNAKLPYDPQKSFVPVSLMADFPLYLIVNADLPVKTVAELVAWSKANPDKSNYGSTSPLFQITAEMFKLRTGATGEHIPFKSSGEIVSGVLTGQTPWAFVDPPPMMGQLKSGKLRVLAGSGSKRSADLPDVPTMAEAGVQGVVVDAFTGIVAPAGTPMAIVKKLEAEINAALKLPDVVERFKQLSVNPAGNTSEAFAALLAREIPIWKEVAQKANIKAN